MPFCISKRRRLRLIDDPDEEGEAVTACQNEEKGAVEDEVDLITRGGGRASAKHQGVHGGLDPLIMDCQAGALGGAFEIDREIGNAERGELGSIRGKAGGDPYDHGRMSGKTADPHYR